MRFLAWTVIVVLIAGALLLARAADTNTTMALQDRALVADARITLADLLPAHAPALLRARAHALDLGRAPQPGAVRALQHDWLQDQLRDSPFADLLIPERVVVERLSSPSHENVLARLRTAVVEYLERYLEKGSWLDSAYFDWPAILPDIPSTSSLRVLASQWDPRPRALRLRVGCVPRQACLPLYVSVYFARHSDVEITRGLARLIAERPPSSFVVANAARPESSATKRAPRKSAPVLARSGTLASMTVESGGVRILIRVVCLQNGVQGQIIRVRNPESKRILRAKVIGSAQVRGPV